MGIFHMIARNAKVTEHRPPLKRVDLGHVGRPRVITREDIEDSLHREPCAHAYKQDMFGNWHLRDGT